MVSVPIQAVVVRQLDKQGKVMDPTQPEEGAPGSSGFNRAASSGRRPAFSDGADPLDDDIPF